MGEHRRRTAVLSATWGEPHDESAFVLRSVAAALSRHTDVDVLAPGPPSAVRADGAFDVTTVGQSAPGRWPGAGDDRVVPSASYDLVVTDGHDRSVDDLVAQLAPSGGWTVIVSGAPMDQSGEHAQAEGPGQPVEWAVGLGGATAQPVGLHVPVHPMARTQSHVGLGFTGYLLVLSDRSGAEADESSPTALAAWLAARFADRHLVVVENGVASVWRWRSLRGLVAIHTRADLWRIVAHARLTVDLAPGPLLARECVESLRYGVPIVAPAGTPAACLAQAGGGLWFRDPAELLASVDVLDDDKLRNTLGYQGQAVADEWYGDPARFSERVATAMATAMATAPPR